MIEKKILVKNIEVNYKVFGEGKPLLILHGWGSKSDRWQQVADLLAQKNIQVIIPDLPGFGQTPPPTSAWNLDNYIEWIREFSEKVPELNKGFYLLGHSFGGSLAVKFTIKYNQQVGRLFLVSAACLRKVTFLKKASYRLSKIVKVFSFLPGYAVFRKAFYKFILKKSDYPYVKEGIMKETYIKVVSEDLSQRLSFVRVPTTIIWGSKDDLTPLSDGQFIHAKIKNSTFIVFADKKHSLQIETPEVLAGKILENIPFQSASGELLSLKHII